MWDYSHLIYDRLQYLKSTLFGSRSPRLAQIHWKIGLTFSALSTAFRCIHNPPNIKAGRNISFTKCEQQTSELVLDRKAGYLVLLSLPPINIQGFECTLVESIDRFLSFSLCIHKQPFMMSNPVNRYIFSFHVTHSFPTLV